MTSPTNEAHVPFWRPSCHLDWALAGFKILFLLLFWVVPVLILLVTSLAAFIFGFAAVIEQLIFETPVWVNQLLGIGSFTFFVIFVGPQVATGPDDMILNCWNAPTWSGTIRAYFVAPFRRRSTDGQRNGNLQTDRGR